MSREAGLTTTTLDFQMLWVDDNPRATKSDKEAIEQWFSTEYGLGQLQITDVINVRDALKLLKEKYFDLILTDYLLKDEDGSILVEKIREDICTDIIFYTRQRDMPPKVKDRVSKAGFTDLVLDRDIVGRTELKIKERLHRFDQVTFLRGVVISAFIELETALNNLLIAYFEMHHERKDHFKTAILENRYVPFGAKLASLEMIIYSKQRHRKNDPINPVFQLIDPKNMYDGIDKLKGVEEHRNNLAHCAVPIDDKLEVSVMGEKVPYDRKDVVGVLTSIKECSTFLSTLLECVKGKKPTTSSQHS